MVGEEIRGINIHTLPASGKKTVWKSEGRGKEIIKKACLSLTFSYPNPIHHQ